MNPPAPDSESRVGRITDDLFRREGSRIVAMLTGHLGVQRMQLAEDVVQEALVRALQTWPYRGVPDNPAAWLVQTAKHLALDQLRREQRWHEKQDGIAAAHERWLSSEPSETRDDGTFDDDTLRMMFVCTHPQLSDEARIALALRTLCGFSPAEIASAFLTTEAAVSKRLVRARQRIRELELPFVVPEPDELPGRLDGVMQTLYLMFNEGYKASSGGSLIREDLCREAIRLTSLLTLHPSTRLPKVHALLALMLLNAARFSGRTDVSGNPLRLSEQDRSSWDRNLIAEGIRQLGLAATGDQLSEYHLEAGIAACHCTAASDESTDWPRILLLYDRLLEMTGSPVVALNRAVAVWKVNGADAGLRALAEIKSRGVLDSYHLFHVVRGTFEAELGRRDEALIHFRKAESLANLPSDREFIAARIRECGAADG